MLSVLFAAWVSAQAADTVPATRLVYIPGRFADACPTEVEVQEGIARRIGRSPFAEPPTRIVVLSLDGDVVAAADTGACTAHCLPSRAHTELFDEELTSLGARTLDSGGGCTDLVEAAELAISIALAPTLAFASKPPEPVAPLEPLAPIAPLETEAAPGAEPPTPALPKPSLLPPGVVLLVGAGVNASLYVGPQPAVGASVSAALRAGQVELRLERREHLPGFDSSLGIVHGAGAFTVAPCAHVSMFSVLSRDDNAALLACATVSLGDVWGVGPGTGNGGYLGGSPFASGGARVGVEWTQRDFASLRAFAQVELYVVKPSFFAFNGNPPWQQEDPVNITFGATYEIPWSL